MGLIDDIKNLQSLPDRVITIKDLIKYTKLCFKSNINKGNKKYNKVIYQREKVEQDDDERRNAI